MRLDVPGSLDDIVIVFVDDDPTLFEITETGATVFDIGNFQGDPSHLGRLCGDCQKDEMGVSIARTADRDDDTDWALFAPLGLTTLLLPCPEIGIG